MPQNKITILSTRSLHASIIDAALQQGIEISVEPFIETEAIQSVEVQQEIEQALQQSATIVFTSMNAVEAVAAYMTNEVPDWTIYCIGQATLQLVKNYFGETSIAGFADNAADLATLIIEDGYSSSVLFFCGNQRRDELPDALLSNDIEVTEIIVYQTVATPHVVAKLYNGIMFFSPAAVNSFFLKNKTAKDTMLFAIGNTTAAAIKKYSAANNIIISDRPGKENVVEKVINYFVHNER